MEIQSFEEILIILLGVLVIVVIIILIWLVPRLAEQKYQAWRERDLEIAKRELAEIARREASAELQQWREGDLQLAKTEQSEIARREASTALQQWKIENELVIRQDAIVRSQAVILGKVTEHLAPYMPIFPYNPKDARFVGSPIDFIVFDGADDDDCIREIVFLEVKSGNSSLNPRQRKIRDAVLAGRVVWRELRISHNDI